ncbi:hypothetical protein BGX27_007392 [Mortierella sp. AM989]|nr:hypothetical protein BGX27_007392 [Mortierella sp. AM989]
MMSDIPGRVCRFLYVFRGKHIEEEHEVQSDEEELGIRPRNLWPDDDSTEHVSRDEEYDISPFNSHDPGMLNPWSSNQAEGSEGEVEDLPTTLGSTQNTKDGNTTSPEQAPVTHYKEHTLCPKATTSTEQHHTSHDNNHTLKPGASSIVEPGQPHFTSEPVTPTHSGNQEPELLTPSPAQKTSSISHFHTHSSKECHSQEASQKKCLSSVDSEADADINTTTPKRSSRILEPDSLRPTEYEQDSDIIVSNSEYYQSSTIDDGKEEYHRRNKSQTPEPDFYDYKQRCNETPVPSTPRRYAGHNDYMNGSPGEIERGYRSETVVRVLNENQLEDGQHHQSSSPPSPWSTPSSPTTKALPLENPFLDVADTRDVQEISEERHSRRLESRNRLAYVLRGQPYMVSPSLYEYGTPSELYGPRSVLWPKKQSSSNMDQKCSKPNYAFCDGLPVSPSNYDTYTPTALGTSLSRTNAQSLAIRSMLQANYASNGAQSPTYEDDVDELPEEQEQLQQQHQKPLSPSPPPPPPQQKQQQKPFHYPYAIPYPAVVPTNIGGGGSSIYGSGTSSGGGNGHGSSSQAHDKSPEYKDYFANAKKQPIELAPAEKHGRDEEDPFEYDWCDRPHDIGVYYWNVRQRSSTEDGVDSRVDKMHIMRKFVALAVAAAVAVE